MCLSIAKNSKAKLAKKDIIVYKVLLRGSPIVDIELDGKPFEGRIEGTSVVGFLRIEDNRVILCQDLFDGHSIPDKKGKKYSWAWDRDVEECIVDGKDISGYNTYYRGFPVEMGKTYTSYVRRNTDSVEEGLHSFAKLEDARSFGGITKVAKCVIPKGSLYYVGIFDGHKSYASDTLTYIEIV